jgi:hypothetical protein
MEGSRLTPQIGVQHLKSESAGHNRLSNVSLCRAVSLILVSAGLLPLHANALQNDYLFSGATWGQVRYPGSQQAEEEKDVIAEFGVAQAMSLFQPTRRVSVELFTQVDASMDSESLDWNHYVELGGGVQVSYILGDVGKLTVGGQHVWDWRTQSGDSLRSFEAFMRWSLNYRKALSASRSDWDSIDEPTFVARTYGRIRYPGNQDENQRENALVEGTVELALSMPRHRYDITVEPFVELRYKADSKNFDFNNKLEPASGVKLVFTPNMHASIQLGVKYVGEYRFKSGTMDTGAVVFLSWDAWW